MASFLSIRNQLTAVVLIIFIGLSLQFFVSTSAQNNLSSIQATKNLYLDRDEVMIDRLNDRLVDVKNLIDARLENLIYIVSNSQNDSGPSLLASIKETYGLLVTTAANRQNTGYALPRDDIIQIPFILELDNDIQNEIGTLVETERDGVLSQLLRVQPRLDRVITNVITGEDSIRENYTEATEQVHETSHNATHLLHQLTEIMDNFYQSVEANSDDTYQEGIYPLLRNIQINMTHLSNSLFEAQTELLTEEPSNQTIFLEAVTERINQRRTGVDSSIAALGEFSLTGDDQTIFDDLESNFTVFDGYVSGFIDALFVLIDLRKSILDFQESDYISSLKDVEEAISAGISKFEREHRNFINIYNEIEQDFRSSSSNAVLILTVVVASIIFLLSVPTIVRIARRTSRLQKSINKLASGDLSTHIPRPGDDEFGVIERSINSLSENLNEYMTQIRKTSTQLAGISEEMAAATEESTASLSEISSNINTITSDANRQNLILADLSEKSENLSKQIRTTISSIEEMSSRILIISSRTNILGLNASISAAKAGKFGKGFGVVAEEIRELSITSRDSANQISTLLESISSTIRELVIDIGARVRNLSEVSNRNAVNSEYSSQSASDQVIMISEISETSNDIAQLAALLDEILASFELGE